MNHQCCRSHEEPSAPDGPPRRGMEHAGVIDLLRHEPETGRVLLAMVESRPWDGSRQQLFQLQEKFNAYLSFVLDGEMAEAYPALAEKPVLIRLDCATPPDEVVLHFLAVVREQIAFQGITLEVQVLGGACGGGCACAAEAEAEGAAQLK